MDVAWLIVSASIPAGSDGRRSDAFAKNLRRFDYLEAVRDKTPVVQLLGARAALLHR